MQLSIYAFPVALHLPFPFLSFSLSFAAATCSVLFLQLFRALYDRERIQFNLAVSVTICLCVLHSLTPTCPFHWDAFWPCFAPFRAST